MISYSKLKHSIEGFFDNISDKVFIIAIRRGLTMMIPFMVLGSFAIFINNLPISGYQQFMHSLFGDQWKSFGGYIYQSTFSIMAIIMNLVISFSLITEMKTRDDNDVNPFIGAVVSLSSLFVLINVVDNTMNLDKIGSFGIFISIITSLIASKLFFFIHKFKRLRLAIYSNAAETYFSQLMKSFFPAIITISVFAVFRMVLYGFGISDIHTAMYDGLQNWFTGLPTEFSTSVIFVVFTHLLWVFGIHGSNVLDSVAHSVYVPNLANNQQLIAEGLSPAHIFTKEFFDVFVYMGGAGATLSLIAALLIGTRRSNTRQVAKISLLPGLINVNEMIIFAVPIVFNFYFIIPFVLIPLVLTFISYIAIYIGLVPYISSSVEWTTPIVMGGHVATGSISGSLLQIFNFVVAALLYLPFVKMYEKSLMRDNKRTLKNLSSEVLKLSEKRHTILLDKQDAEGSMARELAVDLRNDFKSGKIFVNFQPQINYDNTAYGAETLVRWKHEQLGYIPPPVIIALAEETNLINELGNWIFESAAKGLKSLIEAGIEDIIVSVNIAPSQLDNQSLATDFIKIAQKVGIPSTQMEIEITEQEALGGIRRIKIIKELQEYGFSVAIDDFGMGHSSLMYLKEFDISTIKLDGSLVEEILVNESCSDIIKSIVHLGQSKNIHIIAEFVESKEQRELLKRLGCNCYQGYLYSPAVSIENVIDFFVKQNHRHPDG